VWGEVGDVGGGGARGWQIGVGQLGGWKEHRLLKHPLDTKYPVAKGGVLETEGKTGGRI